LVAVLLRKLINASFEGNSWILELTQPTAPLLNFVSGYGLSFYDSIIIDLFISGICVIYFGLMVSLSAQRAGHLGRRLRRDIFNRVVTSSGGTDGSEVNRVANDLLMKVRIIEDYTAYDEVYIFNSHVRIALALVLPLVFAWYGGLVVIALFTVANLVKMLNGRRHFPVLHDIEDNAVQVQAHVLDVIRNGVKINIMGC